MDFGLWTLDFGVWRLEFGVWSLEFGKMFEMHLDKLLGKALVMLRKSCGKAVGLLRMSISHILR